MDKKTFEDQILDELKNISEKLDDIQQDLRELRQAGQEDKFVKRMQELGEKVNENFFITRDDDGLSSLVRRPKQPHTVVPTPQGGSISSKWWQTLADTYHHYKEFFPDYTAGDLYKDLKENLGEEFTADKKTVRNQMSRLKKVSD